MTAPCEVNGNGHQVFWRMVTEGASRERASVAIYAVNGEYLTFSLLTEPDVVRTWWHHDADALAVFVERCRRRSRTGAARAQLRAMTVLAAYGHVISVGLEGRPSSCLPAREPATVPLSPSNG